MSWFYEDPDEWEPDIQSGSYGKYPGTNIDHGWVSVGRKRRAPEEVARIKAHRKQIEDDEILRRADAIRLARSLVP